jgi:hypothetical protein
MHPHVTRMRDSVIKRDPRLRSRGWLLTLSTIV